jgi:hypothetical protein
VTHELAGRPSAPGTFVVFGMTVCRSCLPKVQKLLEVGSARDVLRAARKGEL